MIVKHMSREEFEEEYNRPSEFFAGPISLGDLTWNISSRTKRRYRKIDREWRETQRAVKSLEGAIPDRLVWFYAYALGAKKMQGRIKLHRRLDALKKVLKKP